MTDVKLTPPPVTEKVEKKPAKNPIVEPEVVTSEQKVETAITDDANPVRMTGTSPSDWNIKPLGGGRIIARHHVTNEAFTGTIEEFNKALRG